MRQAKMSAVVLRRYENGGNVLAKVGGALHPLRALPRLGKRREQYPNEDRYDSYDNEKFDQSKCS